MDRYSDPASVMHFRPGILPTKEQELLLRAIFLEDQEVIHLQELVDSTERLLPLLYPMRTRLKMDAPLRARIEELYAQTRIKNQILFADISHLLASFQQAGIETIVLKGAALIPQYYGDPGLRPMVDLDILVRTRDAKRSIDLLKSMGYEPGAEKDVDFSERLIPLIHGYAFCKPSTSRVDLHWHALPECLGESDDEDFWNASASGSLNPADQLLHVCVHGSRWPPAIRWVADAMMILKSEIDWNRLTEQTNQRRLMLPLRHALTYLREKFRAPIPAEVLEAFAPPSKREWAEFHYKTENHFQKLLGNLPLLWYSYQRNTNNANLLGFASFLHQFWGLKSRWLLPFHFLERLAQKLR